MTVVHLTRDHVATDYTERQRIQRTGAVVREGRINGILEVSRSFGDYHLKNLGLSCIPDVRKLEFKPDDRFIILACDGLWKSFTPEEAVDYVAKHLYKDSDTRNSMADDALYLRSLDTACSLLVNEAVRRMSGDNVTCVLIELVQPVKLPTDDAPEEKESSELFGKVEMP